LTIECNLIGSMEDLLALSEGSSTLSSLLESDLDTE